MLSSSTAPSEMVHRSVFYIRSLFLTAEQERTDISTAKKEYIYAYNDAVPVFVLSGQ
jgi:hypothetical protein